jgi:hypothetical protein
MSDIFLGGEGEKRGRHLRLTTLPESVSMLSRKCEILDVSQSYRPSLPVTEIDLHYVIYFVIKVVFSKKCLYKLSIVAVPCALLWQFVWRRQRSSARICVNTGAVQYSAIKSGKKRGGKKINCRAMSGTVLRRDRYIFTVLQVPRYWQLVVLLRVHLRERKILRRKKNSYSRCA